MSQVDASAGRRSRGSRASRRGAPASRGAQPAACGGPGAPTRSLLPPGARAAACPGPGCQQVACRGWKAAERSLWAAGPRVFPWPPSDASPKAAACKATAGQLLAAGTLCTCPPSHLTCGALCVQPTEASPCPQVASDLSWYAKRPPALLELSSDLQAEWVPWAMFMPSSALSAAVSGPCSPLLMGPLKVALPKGRGTSPWPVFPVHKGHGTLKQV